MRRSLGITVVFAAIVVLGWHGPFPARDPSDVDATGVAVATGSTGSEAEAVRVAAESSRIGREEGRRRVSARAATSPESAQAVAREPEDVPSAVEPGEFVLAPPRWEPRRLLASVEGHDPYAPRSLALWWVERETGRAVVVGRAKSAQGGRVRFEEVGLPGRGADLVMAPLGIGPREAGASPVARLGPRPPDPPRGRLLIGGDAGDRLEIHPSEPGGSILVRDRRAREIARWPVAGGTPAASVVPVRDVDTALLLAHERTDGARSRWRAVLAETPRLPREGE